MTLDTHALHTFVDWLIRASWQASVIAGLVLLTQWIFRNHLPARWRHALWLLVVLRLVVPALPTSHTSIFRVVPPAPTGEFFPPLVPRHSPIVVRTSANGAPPTNPRLAEAKPWNWRLVFAGCWIGVAALLTLRLLLTNRFFAQRIASAGLVKAPSLLRLLDDCREQMGIRRPVVLIEAEAVCSPSLYGVLRPRLLLPPGLANALTLQELRCVFLHEMAHIRRHDLLLNWLLVVIRIVHWFNPVIWLAVERCRTDRELACDEMVLGSTNTVPQQEYGMTILKLVQHVTGRSTAPGSIGIVESKADLRRRIARIATFDGRTMRWSLLGLVLVLVLSSVALTEEISPPQAAVSPRAASAPVSQATAREAAPTAYATPAIRIYAISDILKNPDYLLGRSNPAGFALEQHDAEVRRRIGRPPVEWASPANDPSKQLPPEQTDEGAMAHVENPTAPRVMTVIPAPATRAETPNPQNMSERRHHAAVALVELVRQKMLSLHADSPESTAYWRREDVLHLSSLPDANPGEDEALVVSAGPADSEQIGSFLADLREDSKIHIALECRWISFPVAPQQPRRGIASLFKRKDKDLPNIHGLLPKDAWESTTLQPDGHTHRAGPKTVFIDDKQMEQFLKAVEADRRTTILTAPRVTLRNHHLACVSVETQTAYVADFKKVADAEGKVTFQPQTAAVPTGCRFEVSATASRDRRNVQVETQAKATRLVSLVDVQHEETRKTIQKPVTWEYEFVGTTTIPAGQTQVLIGSGIPGDPREPNGETVRLILLITPRIVASDGK